MIAAVVAIASVVLFQEPEILFSGTGPHTRPVVTRSAEARKFFNQGLNFLYAFNHGEAKRSFRAAARLDPECAMAWWGLATANGPHINNMDVDPADEKEAFDALRKAIAVMSDEPKADQALIQASLKRFSNPQAKDRSNLNTAYSKAMKAVWARFPADADIGALYAESMMDLWPWNLWTHDGKPNRDTPRIVSTLETVLRKNPRHPFALHLYIHAVEASPTPARAADEADRLRKLQPGLGHNVHMPSHIDVRLGAWEKAIQANQDAIAADASYRAQRPEQFIYRLYMAHNHHMLAFAAMMLGRSKQAVREIDTMCEEVPEEFRQAVAPFMDGFFSMPFEVRVRFGLWDEVLALPEPADYFPISRALRRSARAIAYAAKGMPSEARSEASLYRLAKSKIAAEAVFGNNSAADLLSVAENLMLGEIFIAEKRPKEALIRLRAAVRAEDALRYDEPPDWIQPTRHTLGAYLIQLGRFQEAEAVYRQDLKRLPRNGWSLYGLSAALNGQGKSREAGQIEGQFAKVWKGADVPITSSCLCLPGK